jgi:hypothetical protein
MTGGRRLFDQIIAHLLFLAMPVILCIVPPLAGQAGDRRERPLPYRSCVGRSMHPESVCAHIKQDVGPSTTFDKALGLLEAAQVSAMTVDAAGQIYLVGVTFDGLPVTPNAFQHDDPSYYGVWYKNGFLLKLDPSGSRVLYGTYLNGLQPLVVKVDAYGNMYVLADHAEPDWSWAYPRVISYPAPITPGAVQPYPGTTITPTLLKIAPSGELVYSTFLGGRVAWAHGAFAVDGRGSVVVCGSTADPAYPVSPGAFQDVLHDAGSTGRRCSAARPAAEARSSGLPLPALPHATKGHTERGGQRIFTHT